ncbi:MAG TPA: TolC family protein [Methylophilaceae bacterium]|nr:TolC family protein [Methylophilaceae bacterium]
MKLSSLLFSIWIMPFIFTTSTGIAAEDDLHKDILHINSSLSLKDVLIETVKHQPQQANLNSQHFGVSAKQALADSWLPNAPAITLYHQNDRIGSGRNERDYQATLELPLWLPNQREAREKVAELSALNLEASQSALAIQTAGLLREAVWGIAFNENELALTEAKYQSALALEEKVNKSFQAGEAAKTDLLLAQQETLEASKNKLLAHAELMHARFRYKLVTGLNQIPQDFSEEKSSLDNYEQSPVWLAVLAKVQYAEEQRNLANIEKKENIQVLINARNSQGAFDTQYNQSMGLSIRIPFATPARTTPIAAASEMSLGQALSEREELKRVLEAALHEAEHNFEVSEDEQVLAKRHWEIASESLRLAEKAYTLGEHDLATLIRIKSQAFDAERKYRAVQIQHQWNIARYNQAVGVLP